MRRVGILGRMRRFPDVSRGFDRYLFSRRSNMASAHEYFKTRQKMPTPPKTTSGSYRPNSSHIARSDHCREQKRLIAHGFDFNIMENDQSIVTQPLNAGGVVILVFRGDIVWREVPLGPAHSGGLYILSNAMQTATSRYSRYRAQYSNKNPSPRGETTACRSWFRSGGAKFSVRRPAKLRDACLKLLEEIALRGGAMSGRQRNVLSSCTWGPLFRLVSLGASRGAFTSASKKSADSANSRPPPPKKCNFASGRPFTGAPVIAVLD